MTGVQTCALPICDENRSKHTRAARGSNTLRMYWENTVDLHEGALMDIHRRRLSAMVSTACVHATTSDITGVDTPYSDRWLNVQSTRVRAIVPFGISSAAGQIGQALEQGLQLYQHGRLGAVRLEWKRAGAQSLSRPSESVRARRPRRRAR